MSLRNTVLSGIWIRLCIIADNKLQVQLHLLAFRHHLTTTRKLYDEWPTCDHPMLGKKEKKTFSINLCTDSTANGIDQIWSKAFCETLQLHQGRQLSSSAGLTAAPWWRAHYNKRRAQQPQIRTGCHCVWLIFSTALPSNLILLFLQACAEKILAVGFSISVKRYKARRAPYVRLQYWFWSQLLWEGMIQPNCIWLQ